MLPDFAYRGGKIDVSKMENSVGCVACEAMAGFYQAAGGKLPDR